MNKKVVVILMIVVFILSLSLIINGKTIDLTKLGLKSSYNLGGKTVTYISWTGERIKNYFDTDPVVRGRLEEAEKRFNCKLDFLQTRDIPATNMARLMAGDSAYDLWNTQTRIGYYELVSQGAAYPMDKVLSKSFYQNLSRVEQEAIKILEYKGRTYGIGSTHWGAGMWNTGSMVTFYNKTLFEREGLPDLYRLYKENKWTWEQADEIVRKTTKDITGDGEIDQFGIYRVRPFALIVSNGGSTTKVDKSGRPVFAMDEPAALEALQLYADWKQLGGIGGRFQDGNAALDMHYIGISKDYMEMKDDWGIVPMPIGPRAKKYTFPYWAPGTVILPVNTKQPEALAALNAFLFREEDVSMNLIMARQVRNRESAEVFIRIQKEWAGESRYLYEMFGGNLVEATIKEIIAGDKTPAVGMGEIKPMVQEKLDELSK